MRELAPDHDTPTRLLRHMESIMSSPKSFAEGLRVLVARRRASFRAQTSSHHRGSALPIHLTEGILEDAKLLEEAALTLKSECNAQPYSLNCMPPEILFHIFMLFAETERPIPPVDLRTREALAAGVINERHGELGWVSLAHVCAKWRNLILDMSSLWAGDVGALPGRLHTTLERAGGNRPLILRLYGKTPGRYEPEGALWDTLSFNNGTISKRVREIHWIERRLSYLEDISFPRVIPISFDALDTLVVSAHEVSAHSIATINAPHLRVADLTNVACLFTSTVLTDLSIRGTTQILNSPHRWGFERQFLFSVLEAHKRTLLRLRLDVGGIYGHALPDAPESLVYLPVLRSLEYCGGFIPANSINPLSQISYPGSATAHIRIDSVMTSLYNTTKLAAHINTSLRLDTIKSLGLAIEENHPSASLAEASLTLRFYSMSDVHGTPSTAPASVESFTFGDGTLRLALHIKQAHMSLRSLLNTLSTCIPPASVQALSYTSSCDPCRREALTILQHFPTVRALHLADPYECGMVMHSLHQPGVDGPRIPKLERLAFSQRSDGHILSSNLLAQQLRARYGHPSTMTKRIAYVPLKELMVDRSIVMADEEGGSEAVNRIANIVGSVYWKGQHVRV